MTPETLQALRRLLFFTTAEAAELIGGVSERSWQYWESGKRTIPDDVIETVAHLCRWRNEQIADPLSVEVEDWEPLYQPVLRSVLAEIEARRYGVRV